MNKNSEYKKLTIAQKSEILNQVKNNVPRKAICVKYKINKSSLCRLIKKENNLKKFVANSESGPGKRVSLKKCEFPRMEKALYKWFLKQRRLHIPISTDILKAKAKQLHSKIQENSGSFRASNGWFNNFKKRHGIRMLKICGEKLSNKVQNINPFLSEFQKIVYDLELSEDQIYNADESGLFYKVLPDKTFVQRQEASAPGRKMSKERITFLACSNASGEHKVKLFVIGKAANPRAFRNFENKPVVYKANKNAWMTLPLFEFWFHNVFVPEVKAYLKSKGRAQKAILLIDNAPCHPKEGLLQTDDGMIKIICFPPNCTALLQPMDQNAIKLTKMYYKKSFLAHLVSRKGDIDTNIRSFNLRNAVCTLANAWNNLKPEIIRKCWYKLLAKDCEWDQEDELPLSTIRNAIRNEHLLVQEISDLLLNVAPHDDIAANDIDNWVNEHNFEGIHNDDVNCESSVEIESDGEVEYNAEAEIEMSNPRIKTTTAVDSLNTCIQWAEQNSISIDKIMTLISLRDVAVEQSLNSKKTQQKITTFFK